MDYFKQNQEFHLNIQDIKETLSELELLAQNEEENQEKVNELSKELKTLVGTLYPHI